MTTTKSALVDAIAEANGFPLNRSFEIIEILLELIKAKLAAGEDVLISRFAKILATPTAGIVIIQYRGIGNAR